MLLQHFYPVSKNLSDFGGGGFIKRKAFMPRTPFLKNVSLAQRAEKQLQNKKARLTQSMTIPTNSTASLGAQVCVC